MSEIKFYIPKGQTIPLALRLYVDDVEVRYKWISSDKFIFRIDTMDEEKAMEIAKAIVCRIKSEHDDPQHGISWRTASLGVVPQDERYRTYTLVEWLFRVRDSY